MRFWLLDAIESYEPSRRLVATKVVSYSEDYLEDHFPEFPVLPGVFMLEAATQAAAWLLRLSEGMPHSIILLREARNVKYSNFVTPGKTLRVEVELQKCDDRMATFKADATVGGASSLAGKLVLERFNLAQRDPALAETDERVKKYLRKVEKAIVKASPQVFAST